MAARIGVLLTLMMLALAACSADSSGMLGDPKAAAAPASDKAGERPVANPSATPSHGSAPLLVEFSAAATAARSSAQIVRWEWNFAGEGGGWQDFTATQGAATQEFSRAGVHVAHLRVTDTSGRSAVGHVKIVVAEAEPQLDPDDPQPDPDPDPDPDPEPDPDPDPDPLADWAHTFGGRFAEEGRAVAVDAAGNSYTAGYTDSFGAGGSDALLLSFAPDGSLRWKQTWGGSSFDSAHAAACAADGSVYFAGSTGSFGAGGNDFFLLRMNAEGDLLWQRTWGAHDFEALGKGGLAVDAAGNAYLTGMSFSFGGMRLAMAKFDAGGALLWQRTFDTINNDDGHTVAVSPTGQVYVAGQSPLGHGGTDVLLLSLDASGNLLWQRSWGTSVNDSRPQVGCDAAGNVYAVGLHGSSAGYAVKFDAAGSVLAQRSFPAALNGIAVNGAGDVLAVGSSFAFGGSTGPLFVLRMDSGLNLTELEGFGDGTNFTSAGAVAFAPDGAAVMTGLAQRNSGSFAPLSGALGALSGGSAAPSGAWATPAGSAKEAFGMLTTPAGTLDSGGGMMDLLVARRQL